MRLLKLTIFILLSISWTSSLHGQNNKFNKFTFKLNDSYNKLNFSFDIPVDWNISKDTIDGTGYFLNCSPSSDSEIVKYSDCNDGIIFRVKYFSSNLDTAIATMGLCDKGNNIYLTIGIDNSIKITIRNDIKGETYRGLYYWYNGEVNCKSNKRKKKKTGDYEFIYFSDGKQTICLITNGKKLDDLIFNRITESFRFD
jgi:hypothetical protein